MSIPLGDLRLLFQKSGNRCAFPSCPRILTTPATGADPETTLSEVAHIVARSPDGPRGHHPLLAEDRDRYDNSVLLCEEHHHIIDSQPKFFTTHRVRQYKADHEALVQRATNTALVSRPGVSLGQPYVSETLHSTLLPVVRMPKYVVFVYRVRSPHRRCRASRTRG
jgi:hypothetical protein